MWILYGTVWIKDHLQLQWQSPKRQKITIDKQKFRTHQMIKNVTNYYNGLCKIFIIDLTGVFAKNERGYRLTEKYGRWCPLLILLLSVASTRRKLS